MPTALVEPPLRDSRYEHNSPELLNLWRTLGPSETALAKNELQRIENVRRNKSNSSYWIPYGAPTKLRIISVNSRPASKIAAGIAARCFVNRQHIRNHSVW